MSARINSRCLYLITLGSDSKVGCGMITLSDIHLDSQLEAHDQALMEEKFGYSNLDYIRDLPLILRVKLLKQDKVKVTATSFCLAIESFYASRRFSCGFSAHLMPYIFEAGYSRSIIAHTLG